MSETTYEAEVFSRSVSYRNLKGETKEVELHFALDPLQLMRLFVNLPTPKKSRSQNPAKQDEGISDEQQLKFLVDIADMAAGWPSDDGETWEPFEDFRNQLAGKAFITKLASSDGMRAEFSAKVILAPFNAFVKFAEADPDNSPEEVKQFKEMSVTMERLFAISTNKDESIEARRARLAAEMAALEQADS